MDLLQPDLPLCKIPLTTPSFGNEAEDNSNRTRDHKTPDDHWYNNFHPEILTRWTLVQLPEKPSLKQTKKNTGRKVAASSVTNKATSLEIALVKRHAYVQ